MPATILEVPIKDASVTKLAALAAQTGRSDAELAAEAIDAWLDIQDWQINGINTAITALDVGVGVSHKDVKAWVASWGSEAELNLPNTGR